MRKKLFPILTLAIMVAFGACSNEEILQDTNSGTNTGDGRTLTLTASMPDEPSTRVGLEQNADKSIDLTWEVGDKLQLAFVQGTTKVKQTITLTAENITNEGKKAIFGIELPAISTGFKDNVNFDLYGVCGGGTKKLGFDMGLPGGGGAGGEGTLTQYYDGDALVLGDADTNPYVQLPYNTGGAKSLETVHFRKDVMLTFTSKGVDATNPQISVVFNHLGSLFNITLKNTGTTSLENLEEAQLVGINNPENMNWAYNSGTGGKTYDLVTGEFLDTENGGNFISLKAAVSTLEAGATTTFWAWYPPLTDKEWPALQLQLKGASTDLATSANTLPARTTPTAAGKAFYFYATWNGAALNFANESITEEYTVNVPTRGMLSSLLTPLHKAKIKKLTVTGHINKDDYEVMKKEMPLLTYVDLSQVTSYDEDIDDGDIENKIPSHAFGGDNPNKTIKTIILPLNITSIGNRAFRDCTGLTGNLTIPDQVTVIDHDAFYYCNNLTGSLIIPNNVTTIGSNAFRNCYGFNSLIMSQNIKTIGWGAFRNCSQLIGTLIFPQSLEQIEERAFESCKNIGVYQFLNATPIPYIYLMLYSGRPVIVPTEAAVTAYKDMWASNATHHTITAASDEQTGTFTDSRDNNIYKFVTIGAQVWMAENLKYLPSVVGPTTGCYVYGYNGTDVNAAKETDNYNTYGVLYNWPAAMASSASSEANPSGVQGVCPTGWHLPSYAEWNQLINYLGGYTFGAYTVAGGKLKETGTAHWQSPNIGATNETGFTALPGGAIYGEDFLNINIGRNGYWWSASLKDTENARSLFMFFNNSYLNDHYYFKENGHSVRCVRD